MPSNNGINSGKPLPKYVITRPAMDFSRYCHMRDEAEFEQTLLAPSQLKSTEKFFPTVGIKNGKADISELWLVQSREEIMRISEEGIFSYTKRCARVLQLLRDRENKIRKDEGGQPLPKITPQGFMGDLEQYWRPLMRPEMVLEPNYKQNIEEKIGINLDADFTKHVFDTSTNSRNLIVDGQHDDVVRLRPNLSLKDIKSLEEAVHASLKQEIEKQYRKNFGSNGRSL